MYVPKLFFYVATYLVYSMFVGSDIIAPEVNREDKLNQQQDTPFIVYARDYMQPCFADYVPHRAEIESSFTVGVAQNEYEPIQVGIYVPSLSSGITDYNSNNKLGEKIIYFFLPKHKI